MGAKSLFSSREVNKKFFKSRRFCLHARPRRVEKPFKVLELSHWILWLEAAE